MRTERRQPRGDRPADAADADDERANGVHLAQRARVADERLLVPMSSPLLVDDDVQAAQKEEHRRDDVLGDRYCVDAGGVGEEDVARHHVLVQRAAHAGRRRVDPVQRLRLPAGHDLVLGRQQVREGWVQLQGAGHHARLRDANRSVVACEESVDAATTTSMSTRRRR